MYPIPFAMFPIPVAPADVSAATRRRLPAFVGPLIVVPGLVLAYATVNLGWSDKFAGGPMVNVFLVQPMVWLLVAGLVVWVASLTGTSSKVNRKAVYLALVLGVFHTSVLFTSGILVGFGLNPFARTWPVWPMNVAYFASSIVAIELARGYLLALWRPRGALMPMVLLGTAFAVFSASLIDLTAVYSSRGAVRVASGELLPLVGEHAMATYLAIVGGPLAAIAYRGTAQLLWLLSPVLPSIPWAVAGFMGIALPFIGVRVLRGLSAKPSESQVSSKKLRVLLRPWNVATYISVLVLWFGIGVFPVRPIAVGGESMAPTYHLGDLVVVHRVSPYEVEVGDVIQYQMPNGRILHRVVAKDFLGDRPVFTTRGDNNAVDDPAPVLDVQVTGVVVAEVPKVGWIGLRAQQAFEWVVGVIR
jgi:signal peptidase